MQLRRVSLEEHVREHKSCRSVSGVEVYVFYAGTTDWHYQRRSCDQAPGGERQAQLQGVNALQVLEKGDDVAFIAIGAKRRRTDQVVVEIKWQEWPKLERVLNGISSMMQNIPSEQRGVVIPETELAKEVRRRGAEDAVPSAAHKRKRLPPVFVASRFGEDIDTIKGEDVEKDGVGELICNR